MGIRARSTAGLLALVFAAPSALAWGGEGHQVVALIAYAHLTPKAKAQTKKLLGDGKDIYDGEVASWADTIRRTNTNLGPYHFIDADVGHPTIDLVADGKKRRNVVDAITDQLAILSGDTTDTHPIAAHKDEQETREQALRWVVHLVGDVEQPLHVTDRNGDKGGNAVKVLFEARKTPTNLHSVWDGDLLRSYVSDFFKASKSKDKSLTDYAESLDAKITAADAKAWQAGTPLDWANESHAVGIQLYAELPAGDPVPISPDYVAKQQAVVEQQLERGGVRLAAVLNKAFSK